MHANNVQALCDIMHTWLNHSKLHTCIKWANHNYSCFSGMMFDDLIYSHLTGTLTQTYIASIGFNLSYQECGCHLIIEHSANRGSYGPWDHPTACSVLTHKFT